MKTSGDVKLHTHTIRGAGSWPTDCWQPCHPVIKAPSVGNTSKDAFIRTSEPLAAIITDYGLTENKPQPKRRWLKA